MPFGVSLDPPSSKLIFLLKDSEGNTQRSFIVPTTEEHQFLAKYKNEAESIQQDVGKGPLRLIKIERIC